MTPSPPPVSTNQFKRPKCRYVVLLGNEDGDAPTVDDEVDYLIPMGFSTTVGGNRVDSLSLRYDLFKAQQRLVDTTAPIGFNRQIELRRLDEEDEPTILVAWGFIGIQDQGIDQRSETVVINARLDRNVFGIPLTDVPFADPDPGETDPLVARRPWVFNPIVDSKVLGNRSKKQATTDFGEHYFFQDTESARTVNAQVEQALIPTVASDLIELERWTLAEAVLVTCWHLNREEEWITNPTREELEEIFDPDDPDEQVRNHRLPVGKFLPDCLDELLHPYGFGWFLEHEIDDNGGRVTTFRFYERGEGVKVDVRLQRPRELIDFEKTNVAQFNASYNIVESANKITILGHTIQREFTLPLGPGWTQAESAIQLTDLEKSQPLASKHPHAYRKWVVNEAHDYSYVVTVGPDQNELNPDPELGIHFPDWFKIKTRRHLRPCISTRPHADDPDSYRYFVEYWNPEADGAATLDANDIAWEPETNDPGWSKVPWSFSVLEKECGIIFESALPPEKLHTLFNEGPYPRTFLRITATLDADERITHTEDRRPESPNGRDLELVLDMPYKFYDRKVHDAAPYESVLLNSPNAGKPDEKDDTTKIENYAKQVQTVEDAAEVSASITLDGADHAEYHIGDLIEKVDGRNLSLSAYDPDQGEPRLLQIVGFNYALDGQQRIELLVETFVMERDDLAEAFDLKK